MSVALYDEIRAHLDGVDHVAREMEAKWGVGRLRLLVATDMRVRFDTQARLLDEAVRDVDLGGVRQHAPAMLRAWQALDALATQAGAAPLSPDWWETATDDGEVIAITRTSAEAAAIVRENRAMQVWTLDEIGRVLGNIPGLLPEAKRVWPGATVVAIREHEERPALLDDDLPDELMAAG